MFIEPLLTTTRTPLGAQCFCRSIGGRAVSIPDEKPLEVARSINTSSLRDEEARAAQSPSPLEFAARLNRLTVRHGES